MKFEFGDLYKFIVSLGVVIVSLAILVPWFFLREPFDLFKTKEEIDAVTEIAKHAIQHRQNAVSFILKYIPWFSSIGFLFGVSFVYFGLKNWHRNQLLLDERTRLEVEIQKVSLRDATKDEVEEKENEEFASQPSDDKELVESKLAFVNFRGRYTKTEKLVFDKLHKYYDNSYNVFLNRIVSGIEIDILMEGKSKFTKDYLVEIKNIRKGFNYGWLKESFLKHLYAKNIYSQFTNRIPNTLFLIVTEGDTVKNDNHIQLIERIQKEGLGRKGKDKLIMISKDEFSSLDEKQLKEKLGI